MSQTKSPALSQFSDRFISPFVLIASNLVPIYGVIFWNWNVFTLMFSYWLESVIIGFFTVLKMMKAEGVPFLLSKTKMVVNGKEMSGSLPTSQTLRGAQQMIQGIEKSFFIPFFMLHFGLFTLVHGIFVIAFFFSSQASVSGIFLIFLSLCFSHFVSYRTNFIENKEYEHTSVEYLFISPYPRIIVMHLTVILGAFFALTDKSIYAIVLLVILKTIADLGSHFFEHRKTFFTSTV